MTEIEKVDAFKLSKEYKEMDIMHMGAKNVTYLKQFEVTKQTESQLQAKCYQWAHNTFPHIRGLFFSVPNGWKRSVLEAMSLKSTGVVAGIPDMVLMWPKAAGIEFKTTIGRVSPSQAKIHHIWADNGIPVHVVNNEQAFKDLFISLLKR